MANPGVVLQSGDGLWRGRRDVAFAGSGRAQTG